MDPVIWLPMKFVISNLQSPMLQACLATRTCSSTGLIIDAHPCSQLLLNVVFASR